MELKPRILVKADTFHIPGTNEQELSQRYKTREPRKWQHRLLKLSKAIFFISI